jgi:hypothetical protein
LAAIESRLPPHCILDDVTVSLPPLLPSVANLVVAQQDQEWQLLVRLAPWAESHLLGTVEAL